MSIGERIADLTTSTAAAIIVAIGGGITWLIRRVLTNQAEIALLKQSLDARDKQRDEDREALADVRDSVKRIEGWIMERGK